MSERDRALFADRLRFNGLPKKAAMIEKANGYFLDEVSALEAIAAARAEGDQAGYECGRREAIEECAKKASWAIHDAGLPKGDTAGNYQARVILAQAAVGAIRALAEPMTQQEDSNGESA